MSIRPEPLYPMTSCRWLLVVEGQNARLAAKLTGWRIDILSESKYAQLKAEEEVAERVSRACMLTTSNIRS